MNNPAVAELDTSSANVAVKTYVNGTSASPQFVATEAGLIAVCCSLCFGIVGPLEPDRISQGPRVQDAALGEEIRIVGELNG